MFLKRNKLTLVTYAGNYCGQFLVNCLQLTDCYSVLNNKSFNYPKEKLDDYMLNKLFIESSDESHRETGGWIPINKTAIDKALYSIIKSLDTIKTTTNKIISLISQLEILAILVFYNVGETNDHWFISSLERKTVPASDDFPSTWEEMHLFPSTWEEMDAVVKNLSFYIMNHSVEFLLPIDIISHKKFDINVNQIVVVTDTDEGEKFIRNRHLMRYELTDDLNDLQESNKDVINSTTMNGRYKSVYNYDHWEPQYTVDLPTFLYNNDFDGFNNWLKDYHTADVYHEHPMLIQYWTHYQNNVVDYVRQARK